MSALTVLRKDNVPHVHKPVRINSYHHSNDTKSHIHLNITPHTWSLAKTTNTVVNIMSHHLIAVQAALDDIHDITPREVYIDQKSYKHITDRHCSSKTFTQTSKLHPQLFHNDFQPLLIFVEMYLVSLYPVEIEPPNLTTQRKVYRKRFPFSVGTKGQYSMRCVLDIHHDSNHKRLATCYPVGAPLRFETICPLQSLL